MVTYAQRFGGSHDPDNPFAALPPMVKRLLIAHAAAHLLLLLGWRISGASALTVYRWFGLAPAYAFGRLNVWQLVSYMFVHDLGGIWHFFFNLLMLYFFAGEMERLYGSRRFLALYFGAGLFAGLVFCLSGALTNPYVPLIGASGAIYAVLVVYAIHFPRRTVLLFFVLPIEMWLLVALLIGLDTMSYLSGMGGGVANLAHLAGALFGYLFVRHRTLFEHWMRAARARGHARAQARRRSDEQRLDALLDKINREGLHTLSAEERRFLKEASRRYQDRGR